MIHPPATPTAAPQRATGNWQLATSFPPLYPILDLDQAAAHGFDPAALIGIARGFAALGLGVQQLRAKSLAAGPFLELAIALAAVVPRLFINDRADIALLSGAAGVHLGQLDLPPAAARGLGDRHLQIGFSTHNPGQFAAAPPCDYLALGPIFSTASKSNPDPVVGIAGLAALCQARHLRSDPSIPIIAIGGITCANAPAVWRARADAVAVIADLWSSRDPVAAAAQFLLAFTRLSCHSPGESPGA